ncbi:uncharacterized protein At4g28440-like [Triticum urartu]|uniref:Single-stranded DNA binding protein Ssb-like OB fold domain-containing protein n=1 Tax=Triticum urartu TaxID=4572 RepID=A0A8R7PVZ3_TRIUA|nr:uncharacterized protein At4g28440-like [Triticum urartu]
MAAAAAERTPVFMKVGDLRPGTSTGHTLLVKVLSSKIKTETKTVVTRFGPAARPTRIAECLVGDETGCILFTARNNQVDMLKPGNTVILWDAKLGMPKGIMKLAVDKRGLVEVTEPASFDVKEDNNFSLVEYEYVQV